MTATEERVLAELEKVPGTNSLALSKTLGVSLDFTRYLCKKLLNEGYLEIVHKGNRLAFGIIRWNKESDYQKMKREFPGHPHSRPNAPGSFVGYLGEI